MAEVEGEAMAEVAIEAEEEGTENGQGTETGVRRMVGIIVALAGAILSIIK